MKKAIIFITITLIFGTLFAQNKAVVKHTVGATYPVKGILESYAVSNDGESIIYLVGELRNRNIAEGVTFVKTDLRSKILTSNTVKLPKEREAANFVYCGTIDNSLKLLFYFYNREKGKVYLFAQTIDKKNLSLRDDCKMILEMEADLKSKYRYSEFKVSKSTDNTKMIIMYETYVKDWEGGNQAGIAVYEGNQLNKLSEHCDISFSHGQVGYLVEAKVDNSGVGYVYYYVDDGKKNFVSFGVGPVLSNAKVHLRRPEFSTHIQKFEGDKDPEMYELKVDGGFLYWMTINPLDSNRLLCSGLYTKPGMVSPIGSFSYIIDEHSPEKISISTFAFSKELLTEGKTEKELHDFEQDVSKDKDFDSHRYVAKGMFQLDNGEYVTLFEQQLNYSVTTRSGNYSTTNYYYIADDILMIYSDSKGDVIRVTKVPKRQISINYDRLNSFAATYHDGKIEFIFNDMHLNKFGVIKINEIDLVIAAVGDDQKVGYRSINLMSLYNALPEFEFAVWASPYTCYFSCYQTAAKQCPASLSIPK